MGRTRVLHMTLAAMVGASLLAACGDDDGGSADGKTTITFWNSFTASDRPAVEELVRRFNQSQGEVVVEMNIQPGDVMTDALLPAYKAGKGPTVVALDGGAVAQYVEQKVLQPVDDFFDTSGIDRALLPKAGMDVVTHDGKAWGVPFAFAPTMLFWNKDLFAAAGVQGPPSTMDDMAQAAVALTKPKQGQYGIAIPDREAPPSWAVLMWADGGGVVSDDNSRSVFGSPQSVAAVDRWSKLMRDQGISPIGLNGVEADNLFGAGKAAMLMNGPWVTAGFDKAGVKYAIAPVPRGSAAQMAVAVSTNMHLSADASEAEKAAAYTFMKFWNTVESQTYWSVQTGYPPNRSDVDPAALAKNPTAQQFAQQSNARFYLGGLVNAGDIHNDIVVPTIQRITNGEGDAAKLMPEAAEQIDKLLKD